MMKGFLNQYLLISWQVIITNNFSEDTAVKDDNLIRETI